MLNGLEKQDRRKMKKFRDFYESILTDLKSDGCIVIDERVNYSFTYRMVIHCMVQTGWLTRKLYRKNMIGERIATYEPTDKFKYEELEEKCKELYDMSLHYRNFMSRKRDIGFF